MDGQKQEEREGRLDAGRKVAKEGWREGRGPREGTKGEQEGRRQGFLLLSRNRVHVHAVR